MLDRIAPAALPRSSLIISDEPLNRETNYRTEFVVALHNQPQGGLAMRRAPTDVRFARGGGEDASRIGRMACREMRWGPAPFRAEHNCTTGALALDADVSRLSR